MCRSNVYTLPGVLSSAAIVAVVKQESRTNVSRRVGYTADPFGLMKAKFIQQGRATIASGGGHTGSGGRKSNVPNASIY